MACISLPTAMLVGAGVTGIGSLASAFLGSNAAKEAAQVQGNAAEKAAKLEIAAANKALKSSKAMYSGLASNYVPYLDAGKVGLTGVKNLLGAGDMDAEEIQKFLESTPGYQFALKQGLQAAQSGFSARGLGQSGAAIKGAADYAEGLASQTYNTLFGNFLSAAQEGQTAVTNLGTLGANFNSANNSLITGAATANAAGVIGAANAAAGGIAGSTNALTSGITGTAQAIAQGTLGLGLNNAGFFGEENNTKNWTPDWWKT